MKHNNDTINGGKRGKVMEKMVLLKYLEI